MKLILSSCDFHNPQSRQGILENLGMPIERCRVLFVPNERASRQAIRSEKYYLRLQEYGFARENITVLDYYDPEPYKDLPVDAVYVSGGNTFQTMYRLRKHGLTEAVIRYVRNGAVYIGGSAGVHIASRNMEHVLQYDNNPNGITDFSGLNLFDGIVICHYTDERKAHYEELKATCPYPVYTLTNDDFLVIEQ
jgi:peptidase E